MSRISSEQQKVDREKFESGYELAFGDEKKIDRSAPSETGEVTWAEMDRRQPDVGQFTGGCMADEDNVADCKSEDAGSTPAAPSTQKKGRYPHGRPSHWSAQHDLMDEWTPEEANCWPLQLWHTDDQGNDTLLADDVPHEIDWDRIMQSRLAMKNPNPRYYVEKGASIDLDAVMKNVPGAFKEVEDPKWDRWELGWRYELKSVLVGLAIGLVAAGATGAVLLWM